MTPTASLPVVALISGRGSNLAAILSDAQQADSPYQLAAVISNRPDAQGLKLAQAAGVATAVLDHQAFPDRDHFDQALQTLIDGYQPGLVVLAGFMRLLTPAFVCHYQGRLLNIHPSLLPQFRGLHTHAQALAAGVPEHGASVHFVVPELDAGPVVLQAKVPVCRDDTPESLAARVLVQEHRIYPQAIRWFATGRLRLVAGLAYLDNIPLQAA